MIRPVHPATSDELAPLTWFAGSRCSIERSFDDVTDVLHNWSVLGVHPRGVDKRVYVFERSCHAVACIDGDGETFGAVSSPTDPAEWAEFLGRHDVRV